MKKAEEAAKGVKPGSPAGTGGIDDAGKASVGAVGVAGKRAAEIDDAMREIQQRLDNDPHPIAKKFLENDLEKLRAEKAKLPGAKAGSGVDDLAKAGSKAATNAADDVAEVGAKLAAKALGAKLAATLTGVSVVLDALSIAEVAQEGGKALDESLLTKYDNVKKIEGTLQAINRQDRALDALQEAYNQVAALEKKLGPNSQELINVKNKLRELEKKLGATSPAELARQKQKMAALKKKVESDLEEAKKEGLGDALQDTALDTAKALPGVIKDLVVTLAKAYAELVKGAVQEGAGALDESLLTKYDNVKKIEGTLQAINRQDRALDALQEAYNQVAALEKKLGPNSQELINVKNKLRELEKKLGATSPAELARQKQKMAALKKKVESDLEEAKKEGLGDALQDTALDTAKALPGVVVGGVGKVAGVIGQGVADQVRNVLGGWIPSLMDTAAKRDAVAVANKAAEEAQKAADIVKATTLPESEEARRAQELADRAKAAAQTVRDTTDERVLQQGQAQAEQAAQEAQQLAQRAAMTEAEKYQAAREKRLQEEKQQQLEHAYPCPDGITIDQIEAAIKDINTEINAKIERKRVNPNDLAAAQELEELQAKREGARKCEDKLLEKPSGPPPRLAAPILLQSLLRQNARWLLATLQGP